MRWSNAWFLWRSCSNLFPFQGRTILRALKTFISSRALNETTENNECTITNLTKSMVISWFWNVTSLLDFGPSSLGGVELVCVSYVLVWIQNSSKNDHWMAKNRWSVVRKVSWNRPRVGHLLPWHTVFWIRNQLLHSRHWESPHVTHWSFLNISTSMNIQAILLKLNPFRLKTIKFDHLLIINNKTAMVWSSLRKLSWKSYFAPFSIFL